MAPGAVCVFFNSIFITIGLALLVLVWNAWHPHWAILARVDGAKGFHDIARHPEGRQVPGLLLFRWDAQLFFANAELFREQILAAVESAPTPIRWVVVAADAITDVDITAADVLLMLHGELDEQGVTLMFAGILLFFWNLLMTYTGRQERPAAA